MSSSSGFQPMPGWYWPDDIPKNEPSHPGASSADTSSQSQHSDAAAGGASPSSGPRSSRRTHWPPRQCRICLETVQPTFNIPSPNLPGFLQSSNVVYEDETGRLIRPCMCKGSSKYVHDACLQAWRHADPSYGRRNYWQCPTCGFRYRLARLGVGRFIGSVCTSHWHYSKMKANTFISCSSWFDRPHTYFHHIRPRICCRPYHQLVS
jgi:hypothetical protein